MSRMLPATRPELSLERVKELLLANGVTGAALLGRRGYYRDSMGDLAKNDRGIYDDAIFIVTPTCFKSFNANTDPSVARPGMAVLAPGVWYYRIGTHNISKDPREHPHYTALVQGAAVEVQRDNGGRDRGFFGINIHKGGFGTTSSAGCQTIYPDQWEDFISTVQVEMRRYEMSVIPYVLTVYGGAL